MLEFGYCLPMTPFELDGRPAAPEEILLKEVNEAKAFGFDYAEANASRLSELSEEGFARLEAKHLPIRTCNCLLSGSFSLWKPEERPALERYVDRTLSRCSRLGVETVAFGSGGFRRLPEGMPLETGHAGILDFLRMCNIYAEKYGLIIAVEPLNRTETNVICTVSEGAELVRALHLPRIRLLADIYHMVREQENPDILTEQADILAHVHAAEEQGRACPGMGNGVYLRKASAALKKAGYSGRISIECLYTDFQAEIPNALLFLQEIFGAEGR